MQGLPRCPEDVAPYPKEGLWKTVEGSSVSWFLFFLNRRGSSIRVLKGYSDFQAKSGVDSEGRARAVQSIQHSARIREAPDSAARRHHVQGDECRRTGAGRPSGLELWAPGQEGLLPRKRVYTVPEGPWATRA